MPRRLAFPRRSHPRAHYPHARRNPLDNGQKAALCILAREAYEHRFGVIVDEKAFEAWRHEQQLAACGCDSLRFAGQEHYRPLLAHFLNLKGESGRAFDVIRQQQTREIELAKAKLRKALAASGKAWAYAEAICKNQNRGLTIDELKSHKPIWRLVFTILNRANSAKRKAAMLLQ
jgi:hypothetical protein